MDWNDADVVFQPNDGKHEKISVITCTGVLSRVTKFRVRHGGIANRKSRSDAFYRPVTRVLWVALVIEWSAVCTTLDDGYWAMRTSQRALSDSGGAAAARYAVRSSIAAGCRHRHAPCPALPGGPSVPLESSPVMHSLSTRYCRPIRSVPFRSSVLLAAGTLSCPTLVCW